MEVTEQIQRIHEFIETKCYNQLLENSRIGKEFLVIDFKELSKHDPDIAELLLEQPEEVIKATELAIEQFDIETKKFRARFKNLPESQRIMIRNIRNKEIGKMLALSGLVRQKSDVRPQVTSAKFECPACGNVLSVLQLEKKFREPLKCGCGRKGKFRLLSKELVDAQGIVLEESPDELEGGEQPKRINVILKEDLVSPLSDKKTNPGTKIRVNGVVKETPIIGRDGGQLTKFELIVEANYLETVEEEFGSIDISREEEEEIIALSRNPKIYSLISKSLAPSIYGHEQIKNALVLQMMGGIRKIRDDGIVTRGDIHILLIGDPGAGKSQLLKRILNVAPKARFVSGKGASGAGLTAAVVKDEFISGWTLEAGALVLANKGICLIDELDKMGKEDRSAMHEALEQQTVTISKANIQATLRSETTVLAAANPKFGRFDPYDAVPNQIDLPNTLINRFDLIFPIKDMPNAERDAEMAGFILNLHQNKMKESDIPTEILRKYFAYAKQNVKPVLTDGAISEIKDYYIKMRGSGGDEGGLHSVPISARQLEALIRLSEASAKIRLSNKVTKKDAKRAIDTLHYCLLQIGIDPNTGKVDIDRITTGISTSQRSKIFGIKEIIADLERKVGKTVSTDEIVKEAASKGYNEDEAEEIIEKLKRAGDIFEPRRGFVQRI